jgi:hypothetical protein
MVVAQTTAVEVGGGWVEMNANGRELAAGIYL